MVNLTFLSEKQTLNVKVSGKRMFFMDYSPMGQLIVQEVDKSLEFMAKNKIKGLEKEELLKKINKMKEIIKEMNNQKEVEDYVIKELRPLGFSLIKIQREGHRPVFVRYNK